ncbi:hypothetical protein [Bacillus sp. AFS040349]|uniref:hypothetical protein n=1 Tax=Bacillus sp. AFS040349 TaxID=2033502 RepID=UPI000BFE7E61|nr:hypothetical protein [Bacillus sp. AFS040349]PGT82180.1 hypothetical protein COD11_15640 [Bacillus sp. AFS040349]
MSIMKKVLSVSVIVLLCISFLTPLKSSAATEGDSIFENLGPKVEYVNVIKGKMVSSQGINYYVSLLQGEPAKLAVIDYNTKKVVDLRELEGAKAAWSIESTSTGIVYIGTTPNEHVYKYNINTRELTDLGKATTNSDTVIWDMAYDEQGDRLFGVTSYGGRVFYYNQNQGFKDLGTVLSGRQYARSVEYDQSENTLYIGVGSPAALIKWNLTTNEKVNLLDYDRTSSSVYDLNLVDGQLFAKMEETNEILHFDLETDEMVHRFDANSRGVSGQTPNEPIVFYSNDGSLYQYNYETKTSEKIQSNLYGSSAVSLDILPGVQKVVGLAGNGGRFYEYQYNQNRFSIMMLDLPPQFVELFKIGSSSTGDIFSSGFISGHLSRYNPQTTTNEIFSGLGQVESVAEQSGKIYFGTYPSANIYEYNPNANWVKNSNPAKLLSLSEVGQTRPSVMVSDEKNNRLFIGSVPKRGEKSGLMTIYDVSKKKMIEQFTLKEGQRVISATYDEENNILYAGTSVYDGSGAKTEDGANIFKIDLNQETYEPVEVTALKGYHNMVSALKWSSDGKIYGILDNKFIVYTPSEEPDSEQVDIYPIIPESVLGMGRNESLLDGEDGYLYGTVHNTLFKVNLENYRINIFRQGDVNTLVSDHKGYFYFNSGANLWRVKKSSLTSDKAIVPTKILLPHVTVTESEFPIARVYTKRPVVLYQKQGNRMVPVKTLGAKQAFRVYGVEGSYYHTGGGYYVFHEDSKTTPYIGRVATSVPTPILKPDGELFRMMMPGEEIRVYNYDEENYDVGSMYTIAKSTEVTYYTGSLTLLEETPLYKYGEDEPVLTLSAGEEYFISGTDGNKLDIGNGYYILYDKNIMKYSKS